MVNAVPLCAASAEEATMVENWGESAATVIPQRIIIPKKINEGVRTSIGESKQHAAEKINAYNATFLLPIFFDSNPPVIQPAEPAPITRNVQSETSICAVFRSLYKRISWGVKAHNAYISYICPK